MPPVPTLVRPPAWRDSVPPPRRRGAAWKLALNALLGFGTVILIGAIVIRVVPMITHRPPRHSRLPLLAIVGHALLLILLFPPIVLAHELGHALAGTLAGWRLQSLFIGPWRFLRDGRGPRVVLHRAYFYYGGAAVVVPREWGSDDEIRHSFRTMVAGGPLASLIVSAALFVALAGGAGSGGVTSGWHFLVFVCATMSLAIFVGTLLPIRQTSTIRNDGLQLMLTRRRDRNGVRPLDPGIRLGALVLMLTERRPRDWTSEMLAILAASPTQHRQTFDYYHTLDRGDIGGARDLLQAVIDGAATADGYPGTRARQEAAIEAAIFEAAWRGDVDAAAGWFAVGSGAHGWDPHAVGLASAAILAGRGDRAAAELAMRRAERDGVQRIVARLDLLRAPLIDRVRAMIESSGSLPAQP
jgi:hypothetical protein